MIPRNRWWKATGTIALVALVVVASGCGSQRTQLNLNKFDKVAKEAQGFNVEKHAKQQYTSAVNLRNDAERAKSQNDFKTSVATSRDAVRAIKQALATAKEMEATEQRNEADHEVVVMQYNQGNEQDDVLYQEIIELQTKMKEKYDKQRWVPTIEIAGQIKQEVRRLLSRLEGQARDDLVYVEAAFKRLIDEDGELHAPLQVQRVRGLIDEINNNIKHPTKNYKKAIALSKQAIIDAQAGIIESKKKKCAGWIELIQKDLITAQSLRAEYFRPDLWNASSEDFANLMKHFWEKEYDFVLTASARLKEQVENLIFETRKASAQYQLDKLTVRLAELRGKRVEDYLPGKLAPVEQDLKDATARFSEGEEEAFSDVEGICQNGQIKATAIMEEFGRLADDYIRRGTDVYNRAKSIATDMERIFKDVPLSHGGTLLDQRLEENKEAIKQDLIQRLADSEVRRQLANDKRTAEEFRDTIELMKTVEDDATTVIRTVFNVVAHNVISEISDEAARYRAEGATEFAPNEMAYMEQLLEEAKQLRDAGRFQEANSKAADARAELERTIAAIRVAVSKAIEDAQAELEKSNETRTAQLRPDDYQRASEYINEAVLSAKGENLKDAVYTARQASDLARRASRDAARIWASQTIAGAQTSLADARQTGAEVYAARILNDADEDLAQSKQAVADAESLMGQEKFEEARAKYMQAKDLAILAGEGAVRAKFRLIDELDGAIVEARAYGAAQYDLSGLTDAILVLNRSKEAMAANQYDLSHELALAGTAKARKITAVSKNKGFHTRLELVDQLIAEATESGGRYYNPQLLASLARDVNKLRVQYDSGTFDSSDREATEIESRLQGLIDNMPNLVGQWLANQRERLDTIAGGDLPPTHEPRISEAKRFLRYAEMDFKRGKYRSSYSNLLRGRRLIDELAGDQAEIAYRRQVRVVLNDLAAALADFDHVLSLTPKTLHGMTRAAWGDKQFIAIAGRSGPEDFRQKIDTMLVTLQAIEAPARMQHYHQNMMEMMSEARMAAIHYERLSVLSEFDPPQQREIIQKAHDLIEKVRNRRAELEASLLPPSVAKQKI